MFVFKIMIKLAVLVVVVVVVVGYRGCSASLCGRCDFGGFRSS